MIDLIRDELQQAAQLLEKVRQDNQLLTQIERAATIFAGTIRNSGKIISCGNGGSHCDAMHFAEELSGRYRNNRRALPAIAISDPSHISCVGNDYGYEQVFSRFIEGLGQPGDALLAISTSGNSPNVLNAVETAQAQGMKVVTLTGKDGGKLANKANIEIRVPHLGYADRIQEIHIKVIHILILLIEKQVASSS
ncbi:D-sedoheptulose 7-phosphate isomerase [Tunicatimonas pelagia]|uniref:D-sedoheptulose 7-phosphate isomerase n=1 Tax=Tunicatimonas pelagia TaxID=931531 RepID=UPI0026651216|nr:D-sedoheptulose 7-phosphate isomerase [Tunicatimonas pelagia]WKN42486.1 D-sedoheptulose 7-phosphate isomerase [Tunicatimonas pelagia]